MLADGYLVKERMRGGRKEEEGLKVVKKTLSTLAIWLVGVYLVKTIATDQQISVSDSAKRKQSH